MRKLLVLPVALALVVVGGVPQPARAQDAATGAVTIQGRVDPATGTWQGTLTGSFSGQHTLPDGQEIPWTVLVAAPFTATYTDASPVCGVTVAEGQATFDALNVGQAFGAWANSLPVPRAIVRATGRFGFRWARAGTSGALVVTGLTLEVEAYWLGWHTVIDADDVTAAGAVTTFTPENVVDCGSAGSLEAELTGLSVRS